VAGHQITEGGSAARIFSNQHILGGIAASITQRRSRLAVVGFGILRQHLGGAAWCRWRIPGQPPRRRAENALGRHVRRGYHLHASLRFVAACSHDGAWRVIVRAEGTRNSVWWRSLHQHFGTRAQDKGPANAGADERTAPPCWAGSCPAEIERILIPPALIRSEADPPFALCSNKCRCKRPIAAGID